MKLKRSLTIVAVGVLVFIGISTGVAHADNMTRLVQGVSNKSVYEAASDVTINGVVNGDIFCAGQTITINATVNGDVLCFGEDITINGAVNGNVRLAGQVVNLNARVTRSASIAAQDVTINSGSSIGNDLSLAGQSAVVNAPVGRDINGTIQTILLSGPVGRNVTLHADSITLSKGAAIAGGLTYTSPHMLQITSGVSVRGSVTYHKSQAHNISLNAGTFIVAKIYWFIALALFSVVLVALFPRLFRDWNVEWGAQFWWAVLTGFIAMFVVPIVGILLALTLIGVPLMLVLALLWIAEAFLTVPLAAYFIGTLIVPKLHPIWVVLIGVIILGVVELIPILGWVVGFFAYWLGSGMLLIGLQRHYRRPTYDK